MLKIRDIPTGRVCKEQYDSLVKQGYGPAIDYALDAVKGNQSHAIRFSIPVQYVGYDCYMLVIEILPKKEILIIVIWTRDDDWEPFLMNIIVKKRGDLDMVMAEGLK